LRKRLFAAGLAAALIAAGNEVSATEPCTPQLSIRGFPAGGELGRVRLRTGMPHFAHAYRHSVTLSEVVSEYAVESGRLVHTAESFADHGPGLAANALAPGARWERRDGRFVLHDRRVLERLVVRVHRDHGNRLDALGSLDLTRWGDRALEIVPLTCAP
jgi:hypothetical protein